MKTRLTLLILLCAQWVFSQKPVFDYWSLQNISEAQLETKLDSFSRFNDPLGQAFVYKFLANKYNGDRSNRLKVVEMSMKAIKLFEGKNDLQKNWQKLFLANLFTEFGDGKQALEYAQTLTNEALVFALKAKDPKMQLTVYQTFIRLSETLETQNKQIDDHLKKCDKIVADSIGVDENQLKAYYFQKGKFNINKKNYTEANVNFDKSEGISRSISDTAFVLVCQMFKAQIKRFNGQNKEALKDLNNLISEEKINADLILKRWKYQETALVLGNLNQLKKANLTWLSYYKTQEEIEKDAINNYQMAELISTFLITDQKYENEKLLMTNQVIDLENQNYIKLLIIFVMVVFVLLLLFIVRIKWQKLRSDSQKTELLLHGQEQERSRLSHELHDSVGNSLAALKTNVFFTEDSPNKENLLKILDELYNSIRNISHHLYPNHLVQDGLERTLTDYINLINVKKNIVFHTYGTPKVLSENQTLNIFRIVQELLANAQKHANATQIEVDIFNNENGISIRVQDDGVGMEKMLNSNGIGLKNVENRVNLYKGHIEYISDQDTGTTVIISFENLD
jgi:two-component system, NarL family, sensor kinase